MRCTRPAGKIATDVEKRRLMWLPQKIGSLIPIKRVNGILIIDYID
jgi:hypothetical protein